MANKIQSMGACKRCTTLAKVIMNFGAQLSLKKQKKEFLRTKYDNQSDGPQYKMAI